LSVLSFEAENSDFEAVFLTLPASAMLVWGSKRGLEGDLKQKEARRLMGWRAFLILLRRVKFRNLGAARKAGHAAIDEHDRANDQGGGKEHV